MTKALAVVVAGLGLVGCSLVNPPGEHVAEPLAPTEFCQAVAVEFCRGYVECCETAPAGYDIEACVARRATECQESATLVLDEPRTGYDADVAGAMLAEARAYVDRCDDTLVAWYSGPDGLYAPFLGTVVSGGVCAPDERPTIASFFACNDPEQTCRQTATNWSCIDRVEVGEECSNIFDCVDGAYCSGGDVGPRTCRPRERDGYPCDPGDANGADECASHVCLGSNCVTPTAPLLYCSFGS
jgi:hypothetical protein